MVTKKVIKQIFCILLGLSVTFINIRPVFATETNTNFRVNVRSSLTVAITTPTTWASGNINEFLRNIVSYSAASNVPGITVNMHMKTTNTSLVNTAKNSATLPTLASNVNQSAFTTNHWGYSVADTGNTISSSAQYSPLVGSNQTPITLTPQNITPSGATSATATGVEGSVAFGAKGDATLAAGTYTGVVVINVITGVIDPNTNPSVPDNPVKPGTDDTATYSSTAGNSTTGTTAYTYRRTNSGTGTSSTTTEISEGDNRSSYNGYTPPQGVTYDTNISPASALATGLGAVATAAAGSGMFFFLLGKQREDDEAEDDENQPLV